jgi:hypothetical protein
MGVTVSIQDRDLVDRPTQTNYNFPPPPVTTVIKPYVMVQGDNPEETAKAYLAVVKALNR